MTDTIPAAQPSPVRRHRLRTALVAITASAALLWVAGLAAIELRWTRGFDAPYPALAASVDRAIVAEGEYLVYSAAACAYCHVPREQWDALDRGERPPLTGEHRFPLPFGDIYSANITPDTATGIGEPERRGARARAALRRACGRPCGGPADGVPRLERCGSDCGDLGLCARGQPCRTPCPSMR